MQRSIAKNKSQDKKPFISIIVPTFKQEDTILKDLKKIKEALVVTGHPFEIIIVVDGKVDKTYSRALKMRSKIIKVVGYEKNRGKGYAIRYGMARAKGDIIGFMDAGMELNPNGISMLLEHFKWYDADIMVGSKRHPVSKIKYPLDRKLISFLSQIFIRILFGINIKDTQVGMKFFKREVVDDVLPRLLVKKFAFDIEIIVVAHYLGYKRIYEAPIELNFNLKGSIISQNLIPILFRTFLDTLAIFYRLKILKYYSNANKRRWRYDSDLNLRINIG